MILSFSGKSEFHYLFRVECEYKISLSEIIIFRGMKMYKNKRENCGFRVIPF